MYVDLINENMKWMKEWRETNSNETYGIILREIKHYVVAYLLLWTVWDMIPNESARFNKVLSDNELGAVVSGKYMYPYPHFNMMNNGALRMLIFYTSPK